MENSLKGLSLAAGIIITCIIISLGFYISREASDTASLGAGQIGQLNAEFADASLTMYEGTQVSGSEVLNVIRKFSEENIGVLVTTKKKSVYYTYKFDAGTGVLGDKVSSNCKQARDSSTDSYINPTGRFDGTVVRDSNGTITGLVFIQE